MEFAFDVKRVQDRLLEMAREIAAILEANDIPYQIAFGTLLGAVRHKGFIPWDDDFDFMLFDGTYDKAIELLRDNLPNDMFLEDAVSEPNYFHAWAHVKDLGTKCNCEHYPQDSLYEHQGLSVDLYRASEMEESEFADYRLDEALRYIERRRQLGFISEDDYLIRRRSYYERYRTDKSDSTRLIVAYPFYGGKYYYEEAFPLRKYSFEGCDFFGPNCADSVLETTYGDYMTLPDEKERVPHYSDVHFDNAN